MPPARSVRCRRLETQRCLPAMPSCRNQLQAASMSHPAEVDTQLGVAEEDAVHVLVHLLKPNLLVAEYFADEDPALVPADVSAVVHTPRLERSGILEARHAPGQHSSAGHVDASWRLVGESFVWALMVEDKTEAIELLLLRRYSAGWRLRGVLFQSTVHSLMPSVLLRMPWLNTFVN